jgi:isopenicillin N synthase-like dioxygenase
MPHKEEYSEFTPDLYPPFPDDPKFPTVELQTISLKKLEDGDEAEQDRAFEAFKSRGFVYLELAGTDKGDTILNGADEVAKVAEKTFALPLEEKLSYKPRNKELFG